jgi:hypothetical protein
MKDFVRRHIDAYVSAIRFARKVEKDEVERLWTIHDSS